MQRLATLKRTTHVIAAFVVFGFSPLVATTRSLAAADDCAAPESTAPGVHAPTGADASTFIYQCSGPYAGLYSNGYYTYNPTTGNREAIYAPNYAYDCTAQRWSMDEYDYSPAQGTFIKSRVTPPSAPSLPTGCPAPVPPTPLAATTQTTPSTESSVGNTGNTSSNSTDISSTVNTTDTNANSMGMSNTIKSDSNSGDALVLNNTSAGSAASGDATTLATIINLLQSSSNVLGGNVATFTANINGNVNGDFMFDPSTTLNNTNTGSQNGVNSTLAVNVNNSTATNAQINNNVSLAAASGDATVKNNTNAGNATSGNASAILNLLNFINSTVSAGQSFIGTININGNLNGDILLPSNFINQLLASSGSNSTNTAAANTTTNSALTNSLVSGINNDISSTATTGNASVNSNTAAGSASSGQAGTNVTLLNLTGSNVVGKNDLLVFVNVLGTWVGMIVDAPAGSTSAALGGGITNTSNNSTNTMSNAFDTNANVANSNIFGINNKVSLAAASGDATIADNTNAGNATSGNAKTAANILNMTGSNLSLSNWFGVLFINVFGKWIGSFGMNTSAGDSAPAPASSTTTTLPQDSNGQQFARFFTRAATGTAGSGGDTNDDNKADNATLASQRILSATEPVSKKLYNMTNATTHSTPSDNGHVSYTLPLVGLGTASILLLLSERDRFFGRKH